MSSLYITEYEQQGKDQQGNSILAGHEPKITVQKIAFTATPGQSATLNPRTTFVRLNADGICSYAVDTNPTAAVTDTRLSAGVTEFIAVNPNSGLKISAITNT